MSIFTYCIYIIIIQIKGEWTLASNGQRLLLKDSINDQYEERVIIFAIDDGLKHLAEAETWMFDGNFTLSPSIFQQLYIIRVKVNNKFVYNPSILFIREENTIHL